MCSEFAFKYFQFNTLCVHTPYRDNYIYYFAYDECLYNRLKECLQSNDIRIRDCVASQFTNKTLPKTISSKAITNKLLPSLMGLFHLKDGGVAKYTFSTSPNRLIQTIECDGGKKIRVITDKYKYAAENPTPIRPISHTRAQVFVNGKPSEAFIHDKTFYSNSSIFGQTLHGEKYYYLADGRTKVDILPTRRALGDIELPGSEAYQGIYQSGLNPYITFLNKYPGPVL